MGSRKPVGPGPGSFELLALVARLGMAGMEPTRLMLGLSQAVVYSHVARLERAGLVWRVRIGDGRGGVIAVSRAGAREVQRRGGVGVVSVRSAAPTLGRHGREVSWVAAALELRGSTWLGPAQMRSCAGWKLQREDGAAHSPDLGLVHADGRPTAIEVELHPKSNARLQAILGGYRDLIRAGELSEVSYVTDRDDVAKLVRRHADAAGIGAQVHIGPLERVIDLARTRSAQHRSPRRAPGQRAGRPAASSMGATR